MFLTPFATGISPRRRASRPSQWSRQLVVEAMAAGRFRRATSTRYRRCCGAACTRRVVADHVRSEKFPYAPAWPDLIDQVIENGLRGFLAEPAAVRVTARGGRKKAGRR